MTFNANRERLRKENDRHNTNYQVYHRYPRECKYNGCRHLTQDEMQQYINAVDKDLFLKSIGKYECEDC